MEKYFLSNHYDLVSPDGYINKIDHLDDKSALIEIIIKNISPPFVGFSINKSNVFFNLKSTLAQIGFNSITMALNLSPKTQSAEVSIKLIAIDNLAKIMLKYLDKDMFLGKLFAADEERKVREPNYLMRMVGRCDRNGLPLLSLSGAESREDLILEKVQGYTIAFLPLKRGVVTYDKGMENFLPTLALMLKHKKIKMRELLQLHQLWNENDKRVPKKDQILLVRTEPLYIRTVFARVASHLLAEGFEHTSACVLEPDTTASGNIYELFGSSKEEITEIPLEFYTLEPHREYVFFEDRDQLQIFLENPHILFKAFKSAPNNERPAAAFIVKGTQLENLKATDWISKEVNKQDFPGLTHPLRQAFLVEKYIEQQPTYPFLKAMEEDLITSQGILLCNYLPSPLMKRLLLSTYVQRCVRAIYFHRPSRSFDVYFSHEDRAFLFDLAKFGIPTYWVDEISGKILKFTIKQEKDTGMFVPLDLVETFKRATFFGVYGSNLIAGNFEEELKKLLSKVLTLRSQFSHPLLSSDTPLALVTGGGPGAMEVGNRVAKSLQILSCANIVDFRSKEGSVINEQHINPHIDAKMTYRLDRLVERQAEFHLDFPIFLQGGIGMDFEYTLEEVRRKVGSVLATPILLFGTADYWKKKVSSRFQCNLESGTIKGSEWVSNCFYCIQTAEQGIKVYEAFFNGTLEIGKSGKIYKDGFCIVD